MPGAGGEPARRRKPRKTASPAPAPPRARLLAIAAALALLGIGALALRQWAAPGPGAALDDAVRRLGVHVTWEAARAGAELRLATPLDTRRARNVGSQASHPGMRVQRLRRADGARELRAVASRKGLLGLDAWFDLHLLSAGHAGEEPARRNRTTPEPTQQRFLAAEPGIDPADPAVARALRTMAQDGTREGATAEDVFRYLVEEIDEAPDSGADSAGEVLAERRGTALGQARTFTALARAAGIPARVVTGFLLDPPGVARPHHWAEVWSEGRWRAYDPSRGRAGSVPASYVPLRRGGGELIRVQDGQLVEARFTIGQPARPQGLPGETRSLAAVLDLGRLPEDAREALAILLLLPFGVLINLIFRTLLRVRTYGLFTATLLALAASAVDWVTTVVLFGLVASAAVAGRALMPGLGLSRSPRLSLVFVLVVTLAALAVSGMHVLEIGIATAGVLVPMVVLSTLVDRAYTVADEQGVGAAVMRLAWTAVVAALAFTVFLAEGLGQWLLRHPEAHLLTAAAMLAVTALARRGGEGGEAPQ